MELQEELKSIYKNTISFKSSGIGINKTTKFYFEKNPKCIEKIASKIKNNTYEFTPYKEKLILKGRQSYPRLVSIPGYEDKLVLKYLSNFLMNKYYDKSLLELAQIKIKTISNEISKFNFFIKLDITGFYDNINHYILLDLLEKHKLKDETVNLLIKKAIKTPTVSIYDSDLEKRKENIIGVPQGLSISNILAEIYLFEFDNVWKNKTDMKYIRYVDDILILYNDEKQKNKILEAIQIELRNKYHLDLNHKKTALGKSKDNFNYLGYNISNQRITIKHQNILKFEKKLEKLFSQYRYLSIHNEKMMKFQLWKINTTITGIKLKNEKGYVDKYGWVFYFQNINDVRLMYHMDFLLKKFSKKYKLKIEELKKFSRTLKEIKYNKQSTYIMDIEAQYGLTKEKREFLIEMNIYTEDELKEKSDEKIIKLFKAILFKTVKELEKDEGKES